MQPVIIQQSTIKKATRRETPIRLALLKFGVEIVLKVGALIQSRSRPSPKLARSGYPAT